MDFFDGFADLTSSFNTSVSGFAEMAGMVMATSAVFSLSSVKREEDYIKPAAKMALAGMMF